MSVTCLTMATKFKLNQDFLKIFVSDCKNDFFEELRMTGRVLCGAISIRLYCDLMFESYT